MNVTGAENAPDGGAPVGAGGAVANWYVSADRETSETDRGPAIDPLVVSPVRGAGYDDVVSKSAPAVGL